MSYQNAKLMNLEDGQKLLEAIDQHKAEIGTVAKDWEDHKTEAFAVGEYVVKDNVTYRFKAAHAANTAWNASEVEETNLGSEITGLKSAITSTAKEKAEYHLGFYRDAQGCLCEIDQ